MCTAHRPKGATKGKLDGKVPVITGGTTGMALADAKLFVDEATKRQFESLIPAARWAALTKSPPPSKPDNAQPGQDIS